MKAVVTAVAGSVIGLLLKRSAPELSLALGTAVTVFAALLAAQLISGLADILREVRDGTGLSAAVTGPVLKCVGIGVVTRLTADLCRDAGQSAGASAVELCGAACAMAAALPLIRSLLAAVKEFV